jgi:hypothetical protein
MAIPNPMGNSPDPQNQKDSFDDEMESRLRSGTALCSWVADRVSHARDVRDELHGKRWEEYTRLWRGFWAPNDANRDSERSKLISPALQQAIEMTVAEMEEAVFGKTAWFDIDDDVAADPSEAVNAIMYRDTLLEDFNINGVPDAISKVFLLGAIYGTGIAKINVTRKRVPFMGEDGEKEFEQRVAVLVEPIRPDQFVIDPSAQTVDEALFCAHEFVKPLHLIQEKIDEGVYRDVPLAPYTGRRYANTDGKNSTGFVMPDDEGVFITEYYGKVPAAMLPDPPEGAEGLVEALVTIANETELLRAVPSPFTMEDRPVVAYQHDTVPGEFWGRGVAEKGYNPQKALDAELRARIDALAIVTAPMMGADVTRLPRNPDMRVRPGKVWLTRGRPSEVLEPILLGQINPATFQQSGDLERMVQMGTGAMDTATPLSSARRNETASGMSMIQQSFIKRSKRTMQNLERQFLSPLIKKSLWRYMQFDPARYEMDMEFVVRATMGIMAKEVEQQQLIQLLGFVPAESPAFAPILKAIFENSASANKRDLMEALEALVQSMQPNPEQQELEKQMQQMAMQQVQSEIAKNSAEAERAQAQAVLALAQAEHTEIKADLEDDKVELQAANVAVSAKRTQAQEQQTTIARERNQIEAMKARNAARSKTTN